MDWIDDLEVLHSHYGTPMAPALRKVTADVTPAYAGFIAASRFCILSTVGPEGTDGSPRGDAGSVVTIEGPETLLMPDWKGNERIDSLRNIVRDERVSLMFVIAGSTNAMRVNGRARLTVDEGLRASFARDTLQPRTVIVIAVDEVYPQCAKALH